MGTSRVIYEPSGPAKEYADLALNIFDGCTNGCTYCYVPDMPVCKARNITRDAFHSHVKPRKDIVLRTAKDAKHFANDPRDILLSFTSDPFPMRPMLNGEPSTDASQESRDLVHTTIRVMEELLRNRCRINVLTKNPDMFLYTLSLSHTLMTNTRNITLGTTLTTMDYEVSTEVEPFALPPCGRLSQLVLAKQLWNMRTWVSIEPVWSIKEAMSVVWSIQNVADYIDFVWAGKVNHQKDPHKRDEWIHFVDYVKHQIGSCVNLKFKRSLLPYVQ